MQFRETLRELKLFAVNRECAVGPFLSLYSIGRQALGVDTQEITHTRFLQFQIPGYAVKRHDMHDILLHRTEDPL